MREEIVFNTDARIVLGGRPHNFMGAMPGIVEELLLAIRRRQPLYTLGAFGGAARFVADAICGRNSEGLTLEYQAKMSPTYYEMFKVYESECAASGRARPVDYDAIVKEFQDYGLKGLSVNGLTDGENLKLLETLSVDHALYLIMKGLAVIRHC